MIEPSERHKQNIIIFTFVSFFYVNVIEKINTIKIQKMKIAFFFILASFFFPCLVFSADNAYKKNITLSTGEKKESKVIKIKNMINEANQALEIGHAEAGIKILQEALTIDADNQHVLQILAIFFYNKKQYKNAIDTYKKLLIKGQGNNNILNNYIITLSSESPIRAISEIKTLYNLYPTLHIIPAQLGMLNSKIGNLHQAIYYYTEAIKKEPRIDYRYNVAVLLDRSNDRENALMMYKEIARLFSNGLVDNSAYSIPIDAVLGRIETLSQNNKNKK